MAAHTHDGIDWTARLAGMRRGDALVADRLREVALRLVDGLPDHPTVVDVGSGTGGMSVALVEALAARGGGTVVLVDAVPELLDAAATVARTAAAYETDSPKPVVQVRPVLADLAAERLADLAGGAHLVWAHYVVHHLPDERRIVADLADALAPGGLLALGEGGLEARCLPWDVGVGEPGLQDRLAAAHAAWFVRMKESLPGAVRLPVGWNVVLRDAGLADVTAFSYLVDLPAPPTPALREWVVERLGWVADVAATNLHPSDRDALKRLLDPTDPAYAGTRDDVFLLAANTVHTGRKP
ncbi:methyltransferase domain-containing protein [Saccharothrix violaceirubra]|uniref:SAM-dependent methyltransferase n=1 Tax=Saccharothrix violaceirubra TaxID=413306 RepID=A0A7W7WYP7_9PSEU|nr:class I SAM-dependent methyltransferase [Saccharothrix violaceirubra]MBB4968221.1 SAM-dependent methyltransferase [Saccharothrix violaceirubra]